MEQETSDRQIAGSDAPDSGPCDPLDAVTEFDTRALDHACGVFRGSDVDGVLRVNHHFLTITGLSPSAARGWDWLAAVHADDRERLRRAVEAACRTGARSAFPIRMQVPLGNITTLRVAIRALPTADGQQLFVGAVETEADADARRAAARRGAEPTDAVDPFEVLVDALPVAVGYAAPDGRFEYTNAAWQERVGPGDTMAAVFGADPDDGPVAVIEALGGWVPWSGTAAVGGVVADVTATPLAEEVGGGHVVTVAAAATTPARIATSPLELCCAVLDASPDFAVVLDTSGGLTYANSAAREFLSLGARELPGSTALADLVTFADSHPRSLRARLAEALAANGSLTVTGDVVKADGTRCPATVLFVGIKNDSGAIDGIVCIARDGADVEAAVRESEQRFRTLAEHSTDLVVVVGSDLQPRYVSPAASRFLGVTAHDRFDPTSSVTHPDDVASLQAELLAIAGSDVGARTEPLLARLLRADGEYRWLELMVTNLLAEPLVGGLVVNGRDVTERRDAEEKLRASEAKFRGLVQNLAEGVTVLAIDGSVKYSSPSAARMLGYEVGHGTGELALDFVLEEDRDRAAEIVAKAFSEPGIQGPIALRILAPDGSTRVVEAMGHNRLDDPAVEGVVVTTRDISERVEAETSARRSDARLRALVENLSDVVTIVKPDGELVYTSPAAETLFGFREGDESWTDPTARMHPDDRDAAMEQLALQVAGETQEPVRFRLRDASGGWRNVEAIARDMTDDPDVGGIVVTTRDVSARTLAERLVADQAQVLTLIARGAPLSDTLSALCGIIERIVGDARCGFLVLDPEQQVLGLLAGPRVPSELAAACQGVPVRRTAIAGPGTTVILDLDVDPRSAGFREIADRAGVTAVWSTPIFDSLAHRVIGTVVMFFAGPRQPTSAEREVLQMFSQTAAIAIERQSAEDLLAHRANHDSLTGLPNRVLFLEFLSKALARAERDDGKVAVLFLDLDRFKHINDGLGHDAGDEVLRELARRLDAVMRPADVVARFGGDEFTVLCDGLEPERVAEHVADIARRLLDVVEEPLSVGGEDRRLSASVGIAVAGGGCTAEDLLRDSDAAMYEAKQRGKARWEIFDDAMRSSVTARLDLESRLERAIERDEFRLYFQPMIELASGRCVGAEALLRWQDPDMGLVTPDAFIGLAEETGLIIPIGEWALAEACRTVAEWEAVGLLSAEFTMSVNLSARQVAQADLVERVHAVIQRSGPMASRLCLEITESVLMEESSVDAMHALRDLGVRFSIDDFGTGYSSLGYLKRFPVDSVKVDRSFVDGLGTDSEDSAIVAAVVSLGHALGLSVVAEGVETSGQLEHLLALGCDRAQGYWFSGPRNPTDFAGLLNDQPWIAVRNAWTAPPAPVGPFGSPRTP